MNKNLTPGHCLCQQTRWQFTGPALWRGYCHCDACRRNCGAPVVAWLGVSESQFCWQGQAPGQYNSSPGVTRLFCRQCGSPMAFMADHYPATVCLYAASLAEPEAFQPDFHVNHGSRLTWLTLEDSLPKHPDTLLHTRLSTQGLSTPDNEHSIG